MSKLMSKLTYANVMSSIAAFGVLAGGGAYAQQRIGTGDLTRHAVTTPKIAPQAVGTGKLKRQAVGTARLKRHAVGTAKIKPNAIGPGKLKNGAVRRPQIADGAIDSLKILDGAIHRTKIATDAVGTNEIADRAVTTTKINPGAVRSPRIADEAVTRAKLNPNMRPHWGVVDPDGNLQRGRGVASATRVSEGTYDVIFDNTVTGCAWLATRGTSGASQPEPDRQAPAAFRPEGLPSDLAPHTVRVLTWDQAGDPADDAFHLSVAC